MIKVLCVSKGAGSQFEVGKTYQAEVYKDINQINIYDDDGHDYAYDLNKVRYYFEVNI